MRPVRASAFLGACLVAVLACATTAFAGAGNDYPIQGLAPSHEVGGLVSIPGQPFPPVPEESVRMAIRIYEPILSGFRFFGETPALARGCGYLASLYAAIGEGQKAERLYEEAERILVADPGAVRDLAWLHNNHGLIQLRDRRYPAALRSFRMAVSLLDPKRNDSQEPRVVALQNLGSTYSLIGDVENAEGAYLQAQDVLRRTGHAERRAGQVTRGNLALLYSTIGDLATAREMLEELTAEPGLARDLRFQLHNNLGYILSVLGEFPEAESHLMQAKTLTAEGSAERALVLMNLTAVYGNAGDVRQALDVGQQASELTARLHGDDSRLHAAVKASLAVVTMRQGNLLKADRMLVEARRALERDSGDEEAFLYATQELALVAQRRGQLERARALSRQALDIATRHLDRILAFGSEAQRLAYRSQAAPYDQLAIFGEPELLADAVLRTKGAVLESLLAERAFARANRPEDRERLDRINSLRVEIMEKIGQGEPNPESLVRALKGEETAMAKRVASRVLPRRGGETVRVRSALEPHQVLVEIIRFQDLGPRGALIPSYGAVVIPHEGSPGWVRLGEAHPVDDRIQQLSNRFGGNRGVSRPERTGNVETILRDLHDRLWSPLAAAFPAGAREIFLSPDAATSFLPWSVLLDEDCAFVAEHWDISQVGSGRDLLRDATESRTQTLLALADGGGDLPYSRLEVERISDAARSKGWSTTILFGEQATETALASHPGPRVLHLATHGGRIQGQLEQTIEKRLERNPMYRGYLLLGGGNDALASWKQGRTPPFAVDGILTAEEVSALDLGDTWLTVLSACATGSGDVRAGEGIMGLRRGFALAGTRNLMLTLWNVNDEAAADFMTSFYDRLLATENPSEAYHATQIVELLRWKNSPDVTSAVARAGAFVLTQ